MKAAEEHTLVAYKEWEGFRSAKAPTRILILQLALIAVTGLLYSIYVALAGALLHRAYFFEDLLGSQASAKVLFILLCVGYLVQFSGYVVSTLFAHGETQTKAIATGLVISLVANLVMVPLANDQQLVGHLIAGFLLLSFSYGLLQPLAIRSSERVLGQADFMAKHSTILFIECLGKVAGALLGILTLSIFETILGAILISTMAGFALLVAVMMSYDSLLGNHLSYSIDTQEQVLTNRDRGYFASLDSDEPVRDLPIFVGAAHGTNFQTSNSFEGGHGSSAYMMSSSSYNYYQPPL